MNLATDDSILNLAGVLLFAEQPEWIVPQFVVKAIRYPGTIQADVRERRRLFPPRGLRPDARPVSVLKK